MPGWAAAAARTRARQLLEMEGGHVRFRHELARNAVRSAIPAATRRRSRERSSMPCWPRTPIRPTSSTTPRRRAPRTSSASTRSIAARRAAALESNREAYSHYRRATDFVDRLPPLEQADCSRSWPRPPTSSAGSTRPSRRSRRDSDPSPAGRPGRRRPVHARLSRFHWFAGDGAPARAKALEAITILEPLGESIELARACSGVSQLAMLADDGEEALSWGGARSTSRPGSATRHPRARARQHRPARRSSSTPARPARCSRPTRSPMPPASARTPPARWATSATS